MSDVAIYAENLGKVYSLGQRGTYPDLRETLVANLRSPFRRFTREIRNRTAQRCSPLSRRSVWALREVSIKVERGELVGILGKNGSGKTTLLRILSRVTHPTEGYVTIRGRMAALLDVGAGFHGELTGRENVFLNSALHGMARMECKQKLDEIVAFAELEQFVDMPLKHYSAGMCLRLAFAVAAHLDAGILLVDELLAQADQAFRKKCIEKLLAAAKGGCAVLLVSHDMADLRALCRRCIVFAAGRVVRSAPTSEAIDYYTSLPDTPVACRQVMEERI